VQKAQVNTFANALEMSTENRFRHTIGDIFHNNTIIATKILLVTD